MPEEKMTKRKYKTQIIAREYFNGDVIITDPCYIIRQSFKEDWFKSDYGKNVSTLGFSYHLSTATLDGD